MGGVEYDYYMRMVNLRWKSSQATDFQRNVSFCDGISRVWK